MDQVFIIISGFIITNGEVLLVVIIAFLFWKFSEPK